MKFWKRKGLKMDPYRAPKKKSSQELQLTLIFVFCCPLSRQMQANFNADNVKPCALKLPKSCHLGEQLKTFDKWVNKVPKYFPLSAVLFHFWINMMRHCCMLQTFLKPRWNLSLKAVICLYITFSNIFNKLFKMLVHL